jgi:oligopeptide transport system substrate-binding protein
MQFFWNICVSACLLFSMAACSSKVDEKGQRHILRLNLCEDPVSLDPRKVRSLKDLTVVKQIFEGLTRIDSEGGIQPALAEKITVSDDFLTYTFYLREAYWSNRDPITAYDFESAWIKALDPEFASDYSYILYPIKNAQLAREGKCPADAIGVAALDDRTLVVQLHTPTPYFLELVAFPTYFPAHPTLELKSKEESSQIFICNGPFCIKKWSPQKELILEKNPWYWDCDSVYLDGISFSIIGDNQTESYLFEKGELDWLGQPLSQNVSSEMLLIEKGKVFSYPIAGTFWLKFNTQKSPFHNKKVRKAFAYAIDRQEIIAHILHGSQQAATGPLPPSMAVQHTPYFKDGGSREAKELLEEAFAEEAWTVETFPKIVLDYYPTERNLKIVQQVQQQVKKALGISIELAAVEKSFYLSRTRQGLFQVGIGDWIADFNDPLAFLELFKYRLDEESGSGINDTGWQNDQFISLLDRSLLEIDHQKRKEILNEAERLLVEEMPIAPIYHYSFDYLKKAHVQDVLLSPLGLADFKSARIVTKK